MKTALAITHVAFEDLGSLADALRTHGFSIEYRDAATDDITGIDPCGPDLLVVLGGPIGVYEQGIYPFLGDEIALLRQRLACARPTLGICLGAQLMAAALGAQVYPGANGKEIGWSPLFQPSDAVGDNPLQPLFDADVKLLHWHGDTFDLPAGARLLASSTQYPHQAFSIGGHALAFQCHPEAEAHALERWYVGHACELDHAGADVPVLRAQSYQAAPLLKRAAGVMWSRWLERAFASA